MALALASPAPITPASSSRRDCRLILLSARLAERPPSLRHCAPAATSYAAAQCLDRAEPTARRFAGAAPRLMPYRLSLLRARKTWASGRLAALLSFAHSALHALRRLCYRRQAESATASARGLMPMASSADDASASCDDTHYIILLYFAFITMRRAAEPPARSFAIVTLNGQFHAQIGR